MQIDIGKINVLPLNLTLEVDYLKSVDQLIALGRYDWVNEEVVDPDVFPIPEELMGANSKISARICYFNCPFESDILLAKMKKNFFRPANFFELLVLGYKYPQLQTRFPIVALGSVWTGSIANGVPVLQFDGKKRILNISWFGRDWEGDFHFLCIPV